MVALLVSGLALGMAGPGLLREVELPGHFSARATFPSHRGADPMNDIAWLAILAGLFLLTLAFARLCEKA